ncbi:MAG: lysophospholipid acyltransferase family protein [Candidatus Bipolaricaulia bacterium]
MKLFKDLFYRFGSGVLFIVTKVLFRWRVQGREYIPKDRGYLVIARHRSYWDIPLVVVALGWRYRIHFVARRKLMKVPVLAPLVKAYTIPIDRDNFGLSDFKCILKVINADKIVGIFPEGTIKKIASPRVGVVRFAERARKEILPVNIVADGLYPPVYPFRFPKVRLFIGRPFGIRDLEFDLSGDEGRDERYHRLSQVMMARLDRAGVDERRSVPSSR